MTLTDAVDGEANDNESHDDQGDRSLTPVDGRMIGRALVIVGCAMRGLRLRRLAVHKQLLRMLVELVEGRGRRCSVGALAALEPSVHDRKECGYEEQCGDCGQQE